MYLVPGGYGVGRSNSMSGPRPNQIVINNSQWEDRSPSRERRRSHGRRSFDDDDWDERAHSPRRYRSRSRERSRDSRRHSPHYDIETERKMKKLQELERKEEEEAARERAKQEIIIAEAKAAKKKKEEEQIRKAAVEEYERKKHDDKMKEQKKKEDEEKFFRKKLKEMYLSQGYAEDSIDIMIEEGEKKKHHHHHHGSSHSEHDGALVPVTKITDVKVMDLRRPTFIKVHRKHLSPETLDAYDLPWEWDDVRSLQVPPVAAERHLLT
ncbi:MAG: hypothetical protein LQ351_003030 [Letrouitia transgressa]|nr:MAG: hypothetical protein LQ351_003030 [Letrouitia transgressa]